MTPTMQELEDCGFKIIKSYTHDHFLTQRRQKGCLTTEKTWDKNAKHKEVSFEVQVDEGEWRQVTFNELNVLDLILNKNS